MNTLLTISEFIGRFHPVLVHLPIGILIMSIVLFFFGLKKMSPGYTIAIKYSLLLGFVAALFSCITGYLLANAGEYEQGIVSTHQWLAIATTAVSGIAYFCLAKNINLVKGLMWLLALLIIVTGHLGGSLTHGEDFLTQGLSTGTNDKSALKQLPNVQQAIAYNDIVQPILQSKCYNCHGPSKQKGKLRLDEPSFIDKGGKEGKAVVAGDVSQSELIKRILLPLENEDHMPPKQKAQLTQSEIELLHWWVSSGADYQKKVEALTQPEKVKPYLMALQTGNHTVEPAISDVPNEKIAKAPEDIINKLRTLNVSVSNISQGSNFLSVNFVAVDTVTIVHATLLQQISKQIAWLKLGHTKISDSVMNVVSGFASVTRLFLNNTNATDKTLQYVSKLSKLTYLNLASTAVTASGIQSLDKLKNLRQLYLYKTGVNTTAYSDIKKWFPSALIDTGGYTVQFLPTDTMMVKEKPKTS